MKFLPQRHAIASFGEGGFRFGDMSHQGHLLVLPSGMRAWDGSDLSGFIAEKDEIDFVVIGSGARLKRMDLAALEAQGLYADVMTTSAAVHSFNLMLGEARRVAAGFLAVGQG
jgi:uncharacterized protein